MALRTFCTNFIQDNVTDICLPKEIVVKGRRLQILHKIFQAFALAVVIYYIIYSEAWYAVYPVEGWGIRQWPQPPAVAVSGSAPHCTELAAYAFNRSDGTVFQPTSCEPVSLGSLFTLSGRGHVFVRTFTSSQLRWEGRDEMCDSNEAICKQHPFFISWETFLSAAGVITCACIKQRQFYTRDAENVKVAIGHGVRSYISYTRDRQLRSIASSGHIEKGLGTDMKSYPGEVLTRLFKPDGTPCKVGGTHTYWLSDVRYGIVGTISEWFACGGVALDSDPKALVFDPTAPPHIRTMGAQIKFHMNWSNRPPRSAPSNIKLVCDITVSIEPIWNYVQIDDMTHYAFRSKQSRVTGSSGVSLKFYTTGKFHFFDVYLLLERIARALVIMQIPVYVTKYIMLYTMGTTSRIYRSWQRRPVDIYHNFHGVVGRMLIYTTGFRGCLARKETERDDVWAAHPSEGDDAPKVETNQGLGHLDLSIMRAHMNDVYQHAIRSGELDASEMRALVDCILDHIDINHDKKIDMGEFVEACANADMLGLDCMVDFFNTSRPHSYMERLLDDTKQRAHAHRGILHRACSAGEADADDASNVDDFYL